ncbi:TniQ family protein [Halothiobacillus sp.]|uniref:TniQ family protein n=1 Tax=Halothiobacillus sp. TaxID=1891311 RepID=UPI002AD27A30|nr:TniQ family protein [Halothiobacillus sp.]
MVLPQLMPNELFLGYLWRVAKINGITDTSLASILKGLRVMAERSCNGRIFSGGIGGALDLVSQLSGLPKIKLEYNHTLAPLFVISKQTRTSPPSSAFSTRITMHIWNAALQINKRSLCYCDQCAQNDLVHNGFSYWRRDHQLPGNFWCPVHLTRLKRAPEGETFLKSPSFYEATDTGIPLAQTCGSNPFIEHFMLLQRSIFWSATRFQIVRFEELVLEKARERKYHFPTPSKHLGTDMLLAYGEEWLDQTMPLFRYITKDKNWWEWGLVPSRLVYRPEPTILLMLTGAFLFDNDHLLSHLLFHSQPKDIKLYYQKEKARVQAGEINQYEPTESPVHKNGLLWEMSHGQIDLPL